MIRNKLLDMNCYDRITIFGGIKGCFVPLDQYLRMCSMNDKTLYIFCGNYLGKGLENKETLEFFLSICDKENVVFLAGENEVEWSYIKDLKYKEDKFKTFKNKLVTKIRFKFDRRIYCVTSDYIKQQKQHNEYLVFTNMPSEKKLGNREINLDNGIEYGGFLKVMTLTKGKKMNTISMRNPFDISKKD